MTRKWKNTLVVILQVISCLAFLRGVYILVSAYTAARVIDWQAIFVLAVICTLALISAILISGHIHRLDTSGQSDSE
ncbi:MAG: hypothetical protein WC465_04400 [Patescibacteria group bacterium]